MALIAAREARAREQPPAILEGICEPGVLVWCVLRADGFQAPLRAEMLATQGAEFMAIWHLAWTCHKV